MIDAILAHMPHRSLLFMPADNVRAHEKAVSLPTDALIFDMEDGVAPTDKAEARKKLLESSHQFAYGEKACYLRINHPDTPDAEEDLELFSRLPQFSGLIIPKVESAATVTAVSRWMDSASCPREQSIIAMPETPRGILDARRIVEGQERLRALIVGTNDLATEMHLPPQPLREGLQHALSHVVLVARAHGLDVYDGVYNRIRDAAGFEQEARQGRALGFDGKALVHPSQVEVANGVFAPSPTEVEQAQELIRQWESQNKGVTTHDGAMVEELHIRHARYILSRALAVENRSQH